MQAVVKIPGSCGELVQGMLGGKNFLISCPVDLFSWVSVKITKHRKISGPQGKEKALQAVKLTLNYFTANNGAQLEIFSQLPTGKGMASSTADAAGACMATALALGEKLSTEQMADLLLKIEPSDGTFFPGISLFDHVAGSQIELLGQPPALKILAVDTGGVVDTLSFNSRKDLRQLNFAKEKEIIPAVELVKSGMQKNMPRLVAKGATISALANQKILYKPLLHQLWPYCRDFGALGVNVAHSGTIIGLLFPDETDIDEVSRKLQKKFPEEIAHLFSLKMIGGGIYPAEAEEVLAYGFA